MKKIAIFSDIHGNLQALQSIIEEIDKEEFDEVICLGDIIGIGPNSKECLDLIMDSNIKVIKGNHEIYQINDELAKKLLNEDEMKHKEWVKSSLNEEEIKYIEDLPMEYEELIGGQLFTFSHFFLNKDKDYYEPLTLLKDQSIFNISNNYEINYMFIGHSHEAFTLSNNYLVTCVGSSGCRKDNVTFYTKLTVDGRDVRIDKKEIIFDKKTFDKEVLKEEYPDRQRVENFCNIKVREKD